MEPKIYFERESPDFNLGIWGKQERIAANSVILCTMTEFGVMNDRRMSIREYNAFIETQQIVTYSKLLSTGTIKEEPKVFIKTIPLCFTSITLPNDVSIECTT